MTDLRSQEPAAQDPAPGEPASGVDAAAFGRRLIQHKSVLRIASRGLIPFILLFGLYVQFHGDFGPGGGFQAGVIFIAGAVLYALIFGLEELQKVLDPLLMRSLMAAGVLLYGAVGLFAQLRGFAFLDYDALGPKSGQHYGIFVIEIGVGVTVAATMITIFYSLVGFQLRREDDESETGGAG